MLGFILVVITLFIYAYFRHTADVGELLFMMGIFASAGYIGGYWDGHCKSKKAEDLSRLIFEDTELSDKGESQ